MPMPERRGRLLVATRTSPLPGSDGSAAYLTEVADLLVAAGFDLHVAWTRRPDAFQGRWSVPTRHWPRAWRRMHVPGGRHGSGRLWLLPGGWPLAIARARHAVSRTLGLPASRPPPAADDWSAPCDAWETSFLRRTTRSVRPDVVLANYCWMTSGLDAWRATGGATVVIAHDCRHRQVHLRNGSLTEVLGEFMSAGEERDHLARADGIAAIQDAEATLFRSLLPGTTVVTTPLPVRPLPRPPELSPDPVVLFFGSDNSANQAAADWLITGIWPAVHAAVPGARLRIAGRIAGARLATGPAVDLLGPVAEPIDAYAGRPVVTAPLLRGSGLKVKLLEACAASCAVVATPVATDGLAALEPALAVHGSADGFASAVIDLLRDPARRDASGCAAAARAAELFSPVRTVGPLVGMLDSLVARHRANRRH